jgi:HK97 family phage major capsid protein
MRKKFLQKRIARLQQKISDLRERAQASTDLEEVRTIQVQIEEIREDLDEANEELAAIEADEAAAAEADPAEDEGQRSMPPAGAQLVNGQILASHRTGEAERNEDPTASMEYRSAFMAYVQKGTPIPAELRQEAISTADTGAAIPITVMNEVINTVRKRYGNLYAKVRKMNVPGGVEIPVGALQATFKWINEKSVSPRQRVGDLGKISFSYHQLELRVSQTFLSNILTVSAFEAELVKVIAIAFLQAMDEGIVAGSGDGSMLGILNDARVTNTIEMTAADFGNWTAWRKKFFAKLPLGYRAGEFIFPLSTVESYLETMADANNNPVFRQATGLEVNDGDAMNPNGRFFGREISLVEPDILPDFDSANANDVVGIFWQPEEYVINENFGFTMMRYFDQETNEWVDKVIAVVDGKVLNPTGFYKIIKKA